MYPVSTLGLSVFLSECTANLGQIPSLGAPMLAEAKVRAAKPKSK
jgi:hypothetical protein